MAKMRNQRIYSSTEHLLALEDELKNYIGRPYRLDLKAGCLTVFALPPRQGKKSKHKQERDKRQEKFERRA